MAKKAKTPPETPAAIAAVPPSDPPTEPTTPPVETPAAPEPPKEPAPTDEELKAAQEKGAALFMNKMFGDPVPEGMEVPAEPEPTPKDPSEPSGEPTAGEPPAPAEPPKPPEATPKTPQDEPQPLDPAAIAEDAAKRALDRFKPQTAPPLATAPPVAEPKLSPYRRSTLEAIKHMEESNPAYKGTGLASRVQRMWEQEDAYRAKWAAENPGKVFDEADDIHNDFYEPHLAQVQYSENDLQDARVSLQEKKEQERELRHQQEINALKARTEMERQQPEIDRISQEAVAQMVAGADPEAEKLVKVNGKLLVNEETMAKLAEHDPILAEHAKAHAERVGVLVTELEFLARFPDTAKVDPNYQVQLADGSVIAPHRELIQFGEALEKHLQTLPKDKTTRDGRAFRTQDEYYGRIDQIRASNLPEAEKRQQIKAWSAQNWAVDSDIVKSQLIIAAGQKVKADTARFKALAQKMKNGSNGDASQSSDTPPSTGSAGNPPVPLFRPPAAVSSGSEKTNASKAGNLSIADRDQAIDSKMGW